MHFGAQLRPAADTAPGGTRNPAALLRDLSLHFAALGITRLARQTGLDRIGIPCYAAIRPQSATLATHQGKGVDDISAQLSAVMEAAEYAIAEAPETPQKTLSMAEARAGSFELLEVTHLLPRGAAIDETKPIRWVEGFDLATGAPVLVPYDAVVLGTPPRDLVGLSQSTNGIAAGTRLSGALLHGLCEVIERDGVAAGAGRDIEVLVGAIGRKQRRIDDRHADIVGLVEQSQPVAGAGDLVGLLETGLMQCVYIQIDIRGIALRHSG